ncbi:Leucine-rich receptor-like protein kinase family protein [Perilla frutescens var. hirtella]|nr:Leucine-rich receptor-like protein kinase family protein [Perilla frutescens var. frutescens]KAH6794675.1 Leucine-rich receptor-like protein kinase family protein [Perilla frutescens var. hirtella]
MPVFQWPLFLFFFFPSLFLAFFSSVSSLNSQGEALLSWKRTLNGSLDALSGWSPDHETPCSWFGISCNLKNEVVEINLKFIDLLGHVPSNFSSLRTLNKLVLSGTNLTGTIPQTVGDLQELRLLDLSDNALNGEIPIGICNLPRLEQLHLNTNRLEGSIPVEIGNLTGLMELTLFDNQLVGEIPWSIGKLRQLMVMRAGGNKNLGGPLPQEIGNCSNLAMLGLAETSISGFLPPSLGQLKRLQTLAIYTTLLSGQIPPELGDCTELRNIYLYENSLAGSIPAQLGKLHNLENLLLWQNNLVGTIPPELGNCSGLLVIDASMNSLTGEIPESFGRLSLLQELQLSVNQISGKIPSQLGGCTALTHIELDNNQISGSIPAEFGYLLNLSLLFLWQNRLQGNIPPSLSNCLKLEAVDFSQNELTGPIPSGIFDLQNLNKLLLLANNLSGPIPPQIGNCSSLIRFRANDNKLTGNVPAEIGKLKNLNFFDLGSNRLSGIIPAEISGCQNLTFLDLHSNSISGNLPVDLDHLVALQFLDVSENMIEGTLSSSLGSLSSLTKLILGQNRFSGPIPSELGSCSRLQLLDLSSNGIEGQIPASLGKIPALEIALNLSWNRLSGGIPEEFTALDKLGVLDISHNQLSGDLHYLSDLQNLVVLNVSHNNFSGHVPDTSFFSKLPLSVLAGNPELCLSGSACAADKGGAARHAKGARVAMVVLLCTACILLLTALYIILGGKIRAHRSHDGDLDNGDDVELGGPWEVTVYQKLDLSITDVAKCLTAVNVIGHGRSGMVYRALTTAGPTIAVKRFRSSEKYSASAFSSEIATLARIRHRNIVRLLGWAANRRTKLLMYDYLPNGTLGALLHDGCGERVEWETRFKIALGVAEGLAYLHHDCAPPILHRDVKTHNILLGDRYEPCLADFGLARFIEDEAAGSISAHPQFAGSYGYFAPEYASMIKITEKSDVYSYGVVLLEIITGKKPVDPSFPDGQHVVQWVRDHLKSKRDPVDIIDQKLQGLPDTQIQEMLQALGIALLSTSNRPDDRPAMKDVVALLKEIKHEPVAGGDQAHKPATKSPKGSEVPSYSSSSVTPAQLLRLQGSSNCSLAYSSSSTSYNKEHQ